MASRVRQAKLALTALLLAVSASATQATAAHAVETVSGSAISAEPEEPGGVRYFYRVDARGASTTQPASGTFTFGCVASNGPCAGPNSAVTFDVTCVKVVGNRAIIGYLTRRTPHSSNQIVPGILVIEDNGPPGPDGILQGRVGFDEVGSSDDPPITTCPESAPPNLSLASYYWAWPNSRLYGDVVVASGTGPLVRCGQVITQDTTLHGDLHCYRAADRTALFIGAPGITLDLGGHTVSGEVAIRNDGHDDVTIRNGNLESDNGAVVLLGVSGNVIRNVHASGLLGGIRLDNSDHNRIVSNEVAGVFLSLGNGSDWNTVSRNTVTRYEAGINVSDSAHNRIVDNVSWTVEDAPLSLTRAHRNTVRRNTLVSGFAYSAPLVRLVASNRNELGNNHVVTYGDFRGIGIELEGSNRNVLRHNSLSGTPLGVWIRSGIANELRANSAEGARSEDFDGERDGFLVALAAQRTVLERNTASGFADDGFAIYDGRAQVGRNVANDNGDFGIEAIPGVIDLGGNRASGNGASEQCRNIACR